MTGLINKTKVRAVAKSLKMKISSDSFAELDSRLKDILEEAARKARADKRKTIMKRDLEKQHDLFEGY